MYTTLHYNMVTKRMNVRTEMVRKYFCNSYFTGVVPDVTVCFACNNIPWPECCTRYCITQVPDGFRFASSGNLHSFTVNFFLELLLYTVLHRTIHFQSSSLFSFLPSPSSSLKYSTHNLSGDSPTSFFHICNRNVHLG